MTYNIEKLNLVQKSSSPSTQTLTTSYQEINGSKGQLSFSKESASFLYKFSFFSSTLIVGGGKGGNIYHDPYMHIKLQKSNDNFVSNIIDVPNCNINVSGDTTFSNDQSWKVNKVMFIVENISSNITHLRLVTRSYSSGYNNTLHTEGIFDGVSVNVFYEPVLTISEI